MPTMLSKSRVLVGKQCPKRLWLEVRRPERRTVSADLQRRFKQGHRLHDIVHQLLPEGQLIGPEVPLADALKLTRRHTAQHPDRPLFEATFSKHRVLVRADMFQQIDGTLRHHEFLDTSG